MCKSGGMFGVVVVAMARKKTGLKNKGLVVQLRFESVIDLKSTELFDGW